jgi:hypothetical protein
MNAGFISNLRERPRSMEPKNMAKKTVQKPSPQSTTRLNAQAGGSSATAVAPRPGPIGVTQGNGSSKLRSIALEPTVLAHDEIARRAYQLWQRTGNPDQLHNWSEAERQLRREFGVA